MRSVGLQLYEESRSIMSKWKECEGSYIIISAHALFHSQKPQSEYKLYTSSEYASYNNWLHQILPCSLLCHHISSSMANTSLSHTFRKWIFIYWLCYMCIQCSLRCSSYKWYLNSSILHLGSRMQKSSSSLLGQSTFPSHTKLSLIQSPGVHWNSPLLQGVTVPCYWT